MHTIGPGGLQNYAENLEPFINQIPDYALYMLDLSGRIISWNAGAQRLTGYTAQEIQGRHFSVFYPPEDVAIDKPQRTLDQASRQGTYQEECLRVRKDGTAFWAAVTITALKDTKGKLHGFAKLTCDITERKEHDAALQAAREARYRALFENSHDAICLTRPKDGAVLAANPAACALFGYTESDLLALHRDELLDQTDPRFPDAWAERAAMGAAAAELRFRRQGGEQFEGRIASKLFLDECGLQLSCTIIHAILEHKRTEERLRESEDRYRTLFNNMTEGFAFGEPILDDQGRPVSYRYLVVNEAFYVQTGIPRGIQGLPIRDYLPQLEQYWIDRYCAVALTGKPDRIDAYNADTRRHYDVYVFSPSPGKFAILFRDITERKRAEQALKLSEERFRLLFENAPIGIVHTDQNKRIVSINPKFAEIFGAPPEEIIGLDYLDFSLAEDRAVAAELSKKLRSGEIVTATHESRMPRHDGTTIWVRVTAKIMCDKQSKAQGGIILFEDITEKKQAEEALRQSEEKFRATFEHAPLGILEVTLDGRIIDANAKLVEMLGYAKDEMVGLTNRRSTHLADLTDSLASLLELAAGQVSSHVIEKRYLRKDRSFVWVRVTTSLARIYGKPDYLVVTVEDITERKQVEEDLVRAMEASYHQATHDMLTGLANRAAFHARLKDALTYARRDSHLIAVHLLDLDRFKAINDTLGHHIGDLLLKEVAKRIKSKVRSSDLVARLGGDEFVVIQTHLADSAAAGILAGKLVEELGRPCVLEGQEVQSGTSIGIVVFPNDAEDPEELMKQADLALYDAKDRGRFNYQFYRQELGATFLESQRMEQELVRALRENEFCLHYLPQFDVKNGRMTGIEALLRWQHPVKGVLTAATFIQAAERARLMPSIGEWTLKTACRQYKEWVDSGLAVPLTLNLSSLQLRDPSLLQMLKRILEETGLPATMLQLEMRESVLWDPRFPKNLLHQLKERGVHLALDDFGTEMTTLPTLDRFPLDAVKPGKGLVRKLPLHQLEAAMLAAIIDVAHQLNIAVCADGVETDDQFAAVKDQGCDSAQGYLLSIPLDARQMKQRIDAEQTH